MKLSKALDLFLAHCHLKGLQQRSIDNYNEFLRNVIKYLGDIDVKEFNYISVGNYIMHLYSKKLSKATIGTYLRHLKVFVKFLESENYIDEIFSSKISIPKQAKKIIHIYSNEEIKEIFQSITNPIPWIEYRNSAIIALMLDSGLRRAEISKITLQDYDIKNKNLKVNGKGDKQRLVPIGKFTQYYIKKYMQAVPYKLTVPLFVTINNEPMTDNAIKLFISKLSVQLNFEFGCHRLRHNFATNYCIDEYKEKGSIDIYKLMLLLGHEDILTTRRYLHLANQIILSKSSISHLDRIF